MNHPSQNEEDFWINQSSLQARRKEKEYLKLALRGSFFQMKGCFFDSDYCSNNGIDDSDSDFEYWGMREDLRYWCSMYLFQYVKSFKYEMENK